MTPRRAQSSGAEAPPRLPPRERLLEAADELFYHEGIQSVGIDRVLERAGVAKASMYTCFGSKEGLVGEYLERRGQRVLSGLRAAAAAQEDPVQGILAVLDAQAQTFLDPGFRGCAFGAARAEAANGATVAQASRKYRDEVRALLCELAAAAGAPHPETLALQLHLLYDGASTAANLDRDPEVVPARRAAAEVLLRDALGR